MEFKNMNMVQVWKKVSFQFGSPRYLPSLPECVTSLSLLATLLVMQARMLLTFFTWLVVNFLSTRTLKSFAAKLLSSWLAQSLYGGLGLFLLGCWSWHFALDFSAHFSFLLRSLWMTADSPGVSATPPNFVCWWNLLKVHSAPSSTSLMKLLNSTGPCLDPQDSLPVDDWPPDGLGAAELPFEPGSSAGFQSSHGVLVCSMLCLSFNEDVVKSCLHSYRRTDVFNSSWVCVHLR